jgi:hypothetical protein
MAIVGKGSLDGASEKNDLAEDLHLDESWSEEDEGELVGVVEVGLKKTEEEEEDCWRRLAVALLKFLCDEGEREERKRKRGGRGSSIYSFWEEAIDPLADLCVAVWGCKIRTANCAQNWQEHTVSDIPSTVRDHFSHSPMVTSE